MNLNKIIAENQQYQDLCNIYSSLYRSISATYSAISMCDHYASLVKDKSIEEIIKYVDCRMNEDLYLLNIPKAKKLDYIVEVRR